MFLRRPYISKTLNTDYKKNIMTSQLRTLIANYLLNLGAVLYINTYNRIKSLFRKLQSLADCSIKMSIRYTFLIDLDSIHNKLPFDHSFNMFEYMFLAPFSLY